MEKGTTLSPRVLLRWRVVPQHVEVHTFGGNVASRKFWFIYQPRKWKQTHTATFGLNDVPHLQRCRPKNSRTIPFWLRHVTIETRSTFKKDSRFVCVFQGEGGGGSEEDIRTGDPCGFGEMDMTPNFLKDTRNYWTTLVTGSRAGKQTVSEGKLKLTDSVGLNKHFLLFRKVSIKIIPLSHDYWLELLDPLHHKFRPSSSWPTVYSLPFLHPLYTDVFFGYCTSSAHMFIFNLKILHSIRLPTFVLPPVPFRLS